MHCRVSPLSYTRTQGVLKLFGLNLVLTRSFNLCIVTKRIADWHYFCKWKQGGSFCFNYATDTFFGNYAGDNVCWIYQVLRWYILLLVCFCCNYAGGCDCFCSNYAVRSFCNTYRAQFLKKICGWQFLL